MAKLLAGRRLYDALKAVDYPLPDNCGEVRLVLTPQGAIMIHYDVFVTDELLGKLGRALSALAVPEP